MPSSEPPASATHTADEIATAYHEAGHAALALVLGRPVQRVSIQPNQLRLGNCELKKGTFQPSKDTAETEILILLAGLAAEARHTGQYVREAAGRDLRTARMMMQQRATTARQIERLERRLLDKAEYLLDQPGVWLAVERMAAALLESKTISGRAARHLFDHALAQAAR